MRPPADIEARDPVMAATPSPAALSALLGAMPRGRLADNVVYFIRMLRTAGLPVGPAKVLDALAAVQAVGIDNRDDFREALAEHLPCLDTGSRREEHAQRAANQ